MSVPFDRAALGGKDRISNIEDGVSDLASVVNSGKSRVQLVRTATGIITDNFHPTAAANQTAPSTQVVYGVLLGLYEGDTVTGVLLRNTIAAVGTLPTTVRFGIANSSGTVLAVSGNMNALANWATGAMPFPFASPYKIQSDGGYYACFVVNGAWGTTQPVPLRGVVNQASQTAFGTSAPPSFTWTGQTDLPAVGSSLTLTAGVINGYYMAFY